MLLYFEYEEKRCKADVTWQKNGESIIVHLADTELAKQFPTDLHFEIKKGSKVDFNVEDKDNERLLELQNVLRRRLQEFVNK